MFINVKSFSSLIFLVIECLVFVFLYLEVKRRARLRGKEQELNDFWYFRFIVQVIYAHETVFFVHNNLNAKKGEKKIVSE